MKIKVPADFDPATFPDHVLAWQIIDGDKTVREVVSTAPDALARWAAALGYFTPKSVRSEQLWIALLQRDAAVFAATESLAESDPVIRIAVRHASTIRRQSQMVAQLATALRAQGFDQVTDAWLDELWREAVQVET
jgi:hypothetical protein